MVCFTDKMDALLNNLQLYCKLHYKPGFSVIIWSIFRTLQKTLLSCFMLVHTILLEWTLTRTSGRRLLRLWRYAKKSLLQVTKVCLSVCLFFLIKLLDFYKQAEDCWAGFDEQVVCHFKKDAFAAITIILAKVRYYRVWCHVTKVAKFLNHTNRELKKRWQQQERQTSNRFTVCL